MARLTRTPENPTGMDPDGRIVASVCEVYDQGMLSVFSNRLKRRVRGRTDLVRNYLFGRYFMVR
jgi:hypothetical protein